MASCAAQAPHLRVVDVGRSGVVVAGLVAAAATEGRVVGADGASIPCQAATEHVPPAAAVLLVGAPGTPREADGKVPDDGKVPLWHLSSRSGTSAAVLHSCMSPSLQQTVAHSGPAECLHALPCIPLRTAFQHQHRQQGQRPLQHCAHLWLMTISAQTLMLWSWKTLMRSRSSLSVPYWQLRSYRSRGR
jgi:hypothetical protein